MQDKSDKVAWAMGIARVDDPSEYICPARNGATKRAPRRSDQALLAWPPQLHGSQRGRREVAEGAFAQRPRPAHGACGEAARSPTPREPSRHWRLLRRRRGMQPGHPDNQTGEKIAVSVDPQGQRS